MAVSMYRLCMLEKDLTLQSRHPWYTVMVSGRERCDRSRALILHYKRNDQRTNNQPGVTKHAPVITVQYVVAHGRSISTLKHSPECVRRGGLRVGSLVVTSRLDPIPDMNHPVYLRRVLASRSRFQLPRVSWIKGKALGWAAGAVC
jgi:hypothetical protein